MINSHFSTQRSPACIVLLNGEFLPWESVTVTNNNYYMSDTYEITLPIKPETQFDFNYWSNITTGDIQIYMGFPTLPELNFTTADLTLLFSGGIDNISIDPVNRMIELSGRDYSYLLIDKKIINSYVNSTSSEIATKFATENGLTPVVTKTNTPVGNYNLGYTKLAQSITEWDFLTFLAQQENFNLFVTNRELHFEPKPLATAPAVSIGFQPPEVGIYSFPVSDLISLKFGRSLTLASDAVVKIRSNSLTTGKSFVETATAAKIKGSKNIRKQTYVYSYPNLTPAQALAQAQFMLQEITQHEITLEATMPGNVTLTKVMPLRITQTETAFDQVYYIDSIERRISSAGFFMTVEAKNHNTNTEVVK